MNSSKNPSLASILFQATIHTLGSMQGSVLVYLIVLILIFGVLGVTIVSLFTTATSSSATPNDSRRAFYLAESGMRFAASELRAHDFDGITIQALNKTTYTLNGGGSFSINAFSPWFKSQEDFSAGSNLNIKIPVGELPNTFLINSADEIVNFTLINFDFVIAIPATGEAVIQSYSNRTATSIELNLGTDTFVANKGEIICLAVHPASDLTGAGALSVGDDLEVSLAAKDYFPPRNGAIHIVAGTGPAEGDYFYENRVDDTANNKVILTNISKLPASPSSIELLTTDYVILSPRNYMVIPSGISGDVTYGGDMGYAMNIYDTTLASPLKRNPDIDAAELTDHIEKIATTTGFIGVDTANDTLNIGGGTSGPVFGAAWYNADRPIGGQTNFCQDGACLFGLGVRVFFVVKTVTEDDGFTFALINGSNNDRTSVGGDIDLGELLGYAGDSRKVSSPTALTNFLDPAASLADKGLLPPKMALEFDFYENSGVNDYCIAGDYEGQQTRNDPTASLLVDTGVADNRDVLQYVYWGTTNLNITCKQDGNPKTYDDNRHDAVAAWTGVWEYPTDFPAAAKIGKVKSDPTVGPDGTIYFGSDDHYLYALNPDGSMKWGEDTGGIVQSSPTIDDKGTETTADDIIYVGSDSDNLHAFNSSGTQLWAFNTGGNVKTKPTVGPTGMVYLGSDGQKFFALNPTSRAGDISPGDDSFPITAEGEWEYSTAAANIKSSAAVDDNNTPADISDDTIYVGTDDDSINAFNQQDRAGDSTPGDDSFPTVREWRFDTGGNAQAGVAVGADGTIYAGADCCDFWAFNHENRAADLTAGDDTFPTGNEWEYPPGGGVIDDVRGAPALAADGTIYFGAAAGTDKGKVYALNPAGSLLWEFDTKGEVFTRPAVSADGNTIYVGTLKNMVYALNKTDRLNGEDFPSKNEWEFAADGPVRAPALSLDGTVLYVGSEGGKDGGKLYALAGKFAEPRNERATLITFDAAAMDSPDISDEDNWMTAAEWAVRLEVRRSLLPADGQYEYTLRTWIRRCQADPCTADSAIFGTYFQDTRTQYAWFPAPNSFMQQDIKLEPADHEKLERILFGFTGATGGAGAQSVLIKNFQLSFIRPNDPIVTDDHVKYPIP